MNGWIAGSVALVLAAAAPAAADPETMPPGPSVSMALDLNVGRDGFRLGGRLFGSGGVWGAWLNGARRPGGFTLDGRLQQPDRAFDFKLDATVEDWFPRPAELPRGVGQL